MTIFYPVPEPMPGRQARFIQIINTAHALARAGATVKLITGRAKGTTQEAILGHYGLSPHPNLEFVFLPMIRKDAQSPLGISIGMVFNTAFLNYLYRHKGLKDVVIFARYLKLAHFIIRTRWLHSIPLVFEAHELFHLTTEKAGRRKQLLRQQRDVYMASTAIVAITERLRVDIVKEFSLECVPTITIPDAVKDDLPGAARPYEQPEREYVFYAGGLYRWKGVDLLIEAMNLLPGETLVISGGGERLGELQSMAAGMGLKQRVKFTGQLRHADVAMYLRAAKIAVIPNLDESVSMYSSPLKMFEYMAANVPIVASRIPGVMEILTDGKDAVFFTPGDVKSLSAALKKLLDAPELAKQIAAAGHTLSGSYTYEKRAAKIIDFLGRTFYN
ncbi:MAG: glycosyltransferase family 4 protein [Nitrospirae bacterium]|nr:glycosyltransferase family 4 protein [Nitrospirota bacterium]